MVFETIAQTFVELSIFHLFFPWLLVLAVSFGVLEKYKIFGENAAVNGTIALSLAFLTIGGAFLFLPPGIFTNFAGALAFSIFGLIGLMLLLGISGADLEEMGGEGSLPTVVGLILAIITFIGAFAFRADVGALLGDVTNVFQEVVMPILVLIFLLLIVGATAGGGGD